MQSYKINVGTGLLATAEALAYSVTPRKYRRNPYARVGGEPRKTADKLKKHKRKMRDASRRKNRRR
jgi:hypothetical protein